MTDAVEEIDAPETRFATPGAWVEPTAHPRVRSSPPFTTVPTARKPVADGRSRPAATEATACGGTSIVAPAGTSVRLLGLDFADLDATAAAALIAQRSPDAPFRYVVTPNADHLVRLARHPELAAVYGGAWLRLLDSRVVARAARLLGRKTPRVAPGSDLTTLLLTAHLKPGEPVTVIGLRPAWLPALVRRCKLGAVAHYDPPAGFERDAAALRATVAFVLAHPAQFTCLAVGSPRQEILAAAIAATGLARGVGLCVGASLDFLSGGVTRAPGWMQLAGLEWLHRLASDPRRLAWRYLVEDPLVFALLFREWRQARMG